MATVAGDGSEEKRQGGECRTEPIPEATWGALWDVLFPAARPVIVRLVRAVRAERRLDPAYLSTWYTQRRRGAARAAGAVRDIVTGMRVLRWVRRDALVDLEPDTTTAFRADLARFEAQWLGYLTRLRGRIEWLARQKEPRGRPSNALRDAVIERLVHIAEMYRRERTGALLKRVTKYKLPGGPLYDIAHILRPWLSCLPSGDEALYRALLRGLRGQKCRPRRKSVPVTTR